MIDLDMFCSFINSSWRGGLLSGSWNSVGEFWEKCRLSFSWLM